MRTAKADRAQRRGCRDTPRRIGRKAECDLCPKVLEDVRPGPFATKARYRERFAPSQNQHNSQPFDWFQGLHLGVQPKKNHWKNEPSSQAADLPAQSPVGGGAAPPEREKRNPQPAGQHERHLQSPCSCKPVQSLRVPGSKFAESGSEPHTPGLPSQVQKVQDMANADPNQDAEHHRVEVHLFKWRQFRQIRAAGAQRAVWNHQCRFRTKQLRDQAKTYGWQRTGGCSYG